MRRILLVLVLAFALAAPDFASATFPGANGPIAFDRTIPNQTGLYVVDPDGSNDRFLTPGVTPAWSPDGQKVLFGGGPPQHPQSGIYTIDADGTGVTLFPGTGFGDLWPSWSPDGARIVVWQDTGAELGEIVIVNPDGTRVNLTRSPESSECCPEWSPDGSRILFVRVSPTPTGSERALYTIAPDGSGLTRIPTPPGEIVGYASWSPDSARLALEIGETAGHSIYTMNADGTDQRRVLANANHPVWSPDGTQLAFITSSGGQGAGLHTSSADGSSVRRVTVPLVPEQTPDWAPVPTAGQEKNRAQACKAERERVGDAEFTRRYGGGANAYGKCVSRKG